MDYGRMSFWTLNFYHMSLPTADNLKLRCPAVSVATISNTLQCVLLDASSRKMFSPSYTVTCVFLLISFINTLHRYSNIYHRYRILCGIPSVYLLYSWKFPSAGLKVLPKKGTTSLFTSTCLPIKDWLSSPKNLSVGGEMCSALLPHMLGGSVIKSFLFWISYLHLLNLHPVRACVPSWICGLLQVAGSHYLLADCNLHFRLHWQQTWGPQQRLSGVFPFILWPVPVPFLSSYFAFVLLPIAVTMMLLALLPFLYTYPLGPIAPFSYSL